MAASFLETTLSAALVVIYANTRDERWEDYSWTWMVEAMILPLTLVCWLVAFFFRPKDEGVTVKILHL